MKDGLLHGLRVLDAGDEAGSTCVRFFASLGAEIRRVEPAQYRTECATVDLAVTNAQMDYGELASANPSLILVSITPFGLTGPYSAFHSSELVASAMGGVLWSVGYEDRPPVKEALDACIFHANAAACCGAMVALVERQASGRGQHVDVSVQEVAASRNTNGILQYQFDKKIGRRSGTAISYGAAKVRCIWTLKDGFAFHSLMTGRFGAPANAALSQWMDDKGVDNPMRDVDWISYDRSALPAETRAVWEAAMDAFFRSVTKSEVAVEGRQRGINATVVNEPSDVLSDPHLIARDFFAREEAAGRTVLAPGRFVAFRDPPSTATPGQAVSWSARGRQGEAPLAGLKVLDFSWALVGSITTKQLADFGADVVKVESSTRPCLSRIDVQVSASTRGNFDDKPWFIHMNTSKRSLRLNIKHPRAREVLAPLLDWADVIVENFSPGTMKSLGLGYETLAASRPDLIMVSGSVYGQTGPLAREWGVDGTGAALSSRIFMTGWPDRPPVTPAAVPYGDVVLPPFMAAALCAAVRNRDKTGKGVHIDASMYEVCVQQMKDAIVASQLGKAPQRSGNRDSRFIHQGVFPALGDESWIAVSIPNAAAWEIFGNLVGGEWIGADKIRSATDVVRDEVDARIAAWTSARDRYALMAELQSAGIPAGVVQTPGDLVDRDPQLRAMEFFQMLENPVLGSFEHLATPIHLSRTPSKMRTAPNLGGDNAAICRDIIGMADETYQALCDAGVFV